MRNFIFILIAAVALNLNAATYYVDFDGGDDSNAGTSTGTAWKHSPGDVNATSMADSTSLVAGDTVVFNPSSQPIMVPGAPDPVPSAKRLVL